MSHSVLVWQPQVTHHGGDPLRSPFKHTCCREHRCLMASKSRFGTHQEVSASPGSPGLLPVFEHRRDANLANSCWAQFLLAPLTLTAQNPIQQKIQLEDPLYREGSMGVGPCPWDLSYHILSYLHEAGLLEYWKGLLKFQRNQ